MKRYGNLWHQIVDWENLLLAARYAQKCCSQLLKLQEKITDNW